MIIRNLIKLKAYKLSYIFSDESYNKLKNNLLYQNLNSNYDLQKKNKQANKNSTNLTEIKEIIPHNDIILVKSKSKLNGNVQKGNYDYLAKSNSKNIFTKPNIQMNNIMIKSYIKNKSYQKKDYKTLVNNTSINMNKANKIKKNLFNKEYLYNKNNKLNLLPKLENSKGKKFSLSLYNKEKRRQRDRYNEKLKEKLLELEECEKKFDVEIFNTLSKLNDEEKRLYEN